MAKLQPRGKTPLSDAVKQAANALKFTEEAATVVLLSDGVETCDADPCAVGAELEALGLDFTAHVIGFDIAEGDRAQLQCLASATGGQYFDAADANGLSEAMKDVVKATAIEAPPELRTQDFQTVTLRVRMDTRALSLPEEITIYGNDVVLGTLTDDTAVIPGLPIEMPFGPITLRAEGQGITGEMVVDITDRTEVIDLEVIGAQADYVIWREGQFPVLEGGKEHLVLLKNTTGVDRRSSHRSYLYPSGSTDETQRVRAGNVQPYAGVYVAVRIPSPEGPGDYDLVPTGTDGTEYGRIPVSFAAMIDPVWQGPREVAVGETFQAHWAGSSNRRDGFQFLLNGKRISGISVQSMAEDDGFQLTAPNEAGIYDLVFLSDFENSLGSKITQLGQIAVGMELPKDDAVVDPIAPNPDTADFDTSDMDAETEAMGGEEFPLLPVGDLHGDWQLVLQNSQRTIPLIKFQLSHAKGEPSSTGGLVVKADQSWGFGPTGGFGEMTLAKRDDGGLLMTIAVAGQSNDYVMTPKDLGWTTELPVKDAGTYTVLLVKADDLSATEIAKDTTPVNHILTAVDERGENLRTPVMWTLQSAEMDTSETLQTDEARAWDTGRAPGTYQITAKSDDLIGSASISLGRGQLGGNLVVLKPENEGSELALDVSFFCSQGAERPLPIAGKLAMFNMTTNTAKGPFFATLNQPQRSADLGPCVSLVSGTFCHDATDDPALLTDIATLQRSLSFK